MVARVVTVAFEGVEARRVDVEVQMTSGTVYFAVVGLGDKAVAESRERVRAAFTWPGPGPAGHADRRQPGPGRPAQGGQPLRPADRPGDHGGHGRDPARRLDDWAAVGELGLDGQIAAGGRAPCPRRWPPAPWGWA